MDDKKLIESLPRVLLPKKSDCLMQSEDDWSVNSCGLSIFVPAGVRMDGASIPRVLWRICGHPMQFPRVYAALVHDFLYSGIGWYYGVNRKEADTVYRDLLMRLGGSCICAYVEYYAIRLFGWSHWVAKSPMKLWYLNTNKYVVRIGEGD